MEQDKKNKDTNPGQEGNQNWDDQNDKRSSGSREPNPERLGTEDTSLGQQGNQNWDDQNDKRSSGTQKPNPERFSGSAFNEENTVTGYGSSQRNERENAGSLDANLSDLPSEKRLDSNNQTGPGLG